MDRPVALVVDRDAAVRAMVSAVLEQSGLDALGAAAEAEAQAVLAGRPVSVLIVGLEGTSDGGAGWIARARQRWPALAVIGLRGESAGAGAANVAGAIDVLPKPIDSDRLRRSIRRSVQHHELQSEMHRLRRELKRREGYAGLIGRSEPMERLREQVEGLAEAARPIWLHGEEGVGKQLVARTLHARSARRERPFVVLSCAGSDETAWRARWLGGANEPGIVQQIDGGTLYLSDVTDLSPVGQRQLADALADPAVGGQAGAAGLRLIAGSRDDPERALERGRLSEPLRFRLASTRLRIPPLRERAGDVPLLASHFIEVICEINHLAPIRISPDALDLLERHDWPGNVQELRNAMEHAVTLAREGVVQVADLPDRIRGAAVSRSIGIGEGPLSLRRFRDAKREVVETFERAYLKDLLEREAGNVTTAAKRSGMLRSALQRLLRKYGIKSAEFRGGRRTPRARPERAPRADE